MKLEPTEEDGVEGKGNQLNKKTGLYLFLIAITIGFILIYSTPISLRETVILPRRPPIKSAWKGNPVQETTAHTTSETTVDAEISADIQTNYEGTSSSRPPVSSQSITNTFGVTTFADFTITSSGEHDAAVSNTKPTHRRSQVTVTTTVTPSNARQNSRAQGNSTIVGPDAGSSKRTIDVGSIQIRKITSNGESTLGDNDAISISKTDRTQDTLFPLYPGAITNIVSHTTVAPPPTRRGSASASDLNTQAPTEATTFNVTTDKYLVDSKNCKIPDFDPFHPSIKHMIEYSKPLSCADYPALTYSNGNTLYINKTVAALKGIHSFKCCYKPFFRDSDGKSDNKHRFGNKCKKMKIATKVGDEFVRVECTAENGSVFYQNYHSFIQEKPDVEKRCKNSTAKYSVLVIGVDAMSRMNMHRQLNKTISFLFENMGALEMYGFNKVGDNTFPNLVPLLIGYNLTELEKVCWNSSDAPVDNCNFIWKKFSKKGFRTLYAEDTPHISTFNYMKVGFFHQPTDYYFRNFILAYEDALGRNKPLNCHLCVGSVSETEAVLHWVEKFVSRFKKRPYFAFAWINSLTHDYLNMGSSGDQMYLRFFQTMYNTGALNNTIVVLMGDHGMRWGEIRSTYIGRLEERLPMLVLLVPPVFRSEYPLLTRNLEQNRHRLVTPYDLHATLDHFLNLNEGWKSVDTSSVPTELKDIYSKRGLSLLSRIPEDRSCNDAFIEEHWCTCDLFLATDPKSREVRSIAMYVVNELNEILQPYQNICARLKLSAVKQARVEPPHKRTGVIKKNTNIYAVVIQTLPGEGLFEATVQYDDDEGEYQLLGTISRLNLYRNQSDCVPDAVLHKYCYCL